MAVHDTEETKGYRTRVVQFTCASETLRGIWTPFASSPLTTGTITALGNRRTFSLCSFIENSKFETSSTKSV